MSILEISELVAITEMNWRLIYEGSHLDLEGVSELNFPQDQWLSR